MCWPGSRLSSLLAPGGTWSRPAPAPPVSSLDSGKSRAARGPVRASQAGGRLENRGREPLSECGQDTAAPVGKFWREGTQGRAHGPVHRPEKGQLCPSAGTTRAWGRSPAAPLTGCVTPSWHLRDHLSVSRSPHFTAEEADVTCPGSPAGTRQSWDQNPVSRGSRWVHYGPSGSKVARKDLTASRSRGPLGLWGGDEGGAAGRLSGQRQDNGRGVGGGCRRSP